MKSDATGLKRARRAGGSQAIWFGIIFALSVLFSSGRVATVSAQAVDGRPDVRVKPQQTPTPEITGSGQESGEGVDWARLPAWRRIEFFGVRAQGRRFAFVVDCSGSMAHAGRLARAKAELRRTIQQMRDPQHFLVIFFNDEAWTGPSGGLEMPCDLASKEHLFRWMRTIEPEGETEPRSALRLALGQKPDGVFFLTDGELPEGTAESIPGINPGRVPIHCIDLSGGAGAETLRRIARESRGTYSAR
jgi:hypothetical protein